VIEQTEAMRRIIGSINDVLTVTRREIKLYGADVALEMHCERSNMWIQAHQMMMPESKEEEIAVVVFAAALQCVNVLFATGEVKYDG
jgi:hypothetical protein